MVDTVVEKFIIIWEVCLCVGFFVCFVVVVVVVFFVFVFFWGRGSREAESRV